MAAFSYNYTQLIEIVKELSSKEAVQRYLLDLFPFVFKDKPEIYYDLRNRICKNLGTHPQNFSIVGSAKLGFSIAPKKLGKPFDDDSDIDIVIISDRLFEEVWFKLIEYKDKVVIKLDPEAKQRFRDLQMVLFYGQLRMDKLANSFNFAKKWWQLFNQLSVEPKYGQRQIRATIFKSWNHACNYYEKSIEILKE